ncbi:MAG: hypothetical protein ABF651_02805 [Sporolactobacillus sp.]
MAIKLKNKRAGLLVVLCLLFVFINGLIGFRFFQTYFGSYTKTGPFYSSLYFFKNSLVSQRLNHPTLTEIKSLPVSAKAIHEFRYRFGNFGKQEANIRDQYDSKIRKAEKEKNNYLADLHKKEQNDKLAAIRLNFKSDAHVASQVRKERQKAIKKYDAHLKRNSATFKDQASVFKYYFVNKETGNVVTNLSPSELSGKSDDSGKIYLHTYKQFKTNRQDDSVNPKVSAILNLTAKTYSGKIVVNKDHLSGSFGVHYRHFLLMRGVAVFVLFVNIALLLFAVLLIWKNKMRHLDGLDSLHRLFLRIPIDFYSVLFLCQCLVALQFLKTASRLAAYAVFPDSVTAVFYLAMFGFFLIFIYQCQWIIDLLRDHRRFLECWQKSIIGGCQGAIYAMLFH